jgi:hypothetical protein
MFALPRRPKTATSGCNRTVEAAHKRPKTQRATGISATCRSFVNARLREESRCAVKAPSLHRRAESCNGCRKRSATSSSDCVAGPSSFQTPSGRPGGVNATPAVPLRDCVSPVVDLRTACVRDRRSDLLCIRGGSRTLPGHAPRRTSGRRRESIPYSACVCVRASRASRSFSQLDVHTRPDLEVQLLRF